MASRWALPCTETGGRVKGHRRSLRASAVCLRYNKTATRVLEYAQPAEQKIEDAEPGNGDFTGPSGQPDIACAVEIRALTWRRQTIRGKIIDEAENADAKKPAFSKAANDLKALNRDDADFRDDLPDARADCRYLEERQEYPRQASPFSWTTPEPIPQVDEGCLHVVEVWHPGPPYFDGESWVSAQPKLAKSLERQSHGPHLSLGF